MRKVLHVLWELLPPLMCWFGGYLVGRQRGYLAGWRDGFRRAMGEASLFVSLVSMALVSNGLPPIPNPFREFAEGGRLRKETLH